MKQNAGTIDRMLRVLFGAILVLLSVQGTLGYWGYLGVLPIITGLIGFCPAYPILGINTCTIKKPSE